MLTSAERAAASIVAFLATAIVVSYAMDRIGLPLAPLLVLAASVAAAAAVFVVVTRVRRVADDGRADGYAFGGIVAVVLVYLAWLAWPSWLPLGTGPDLTHHLALIDYIERHARLPHDPQLGAVLGEMINYTPGLHLLAALGGAWTGTDGFRASYPIVALSVAVKAGLVFLIARRMMPGGRATSGVAQTPLAVVAPLLLFVPREYFLGSFAESSYLAQVVSEMFAMAMWLAIVIWDERPSTPAAVAIAVAGTATLLVWPVWLGPLILTLSAVMALRSDLTIGDRVRHLAIATVPIGFVAAIHAIGRMHAIAIVSVAGFVAYPTVAMFGWWFLSLAAIGTAASLFMRRSRTVAMLLVAIALQSAVLFFVATRSGADRPYVALKMMYLAIYPLAIAAAITLGRGARVFTARGEVAVGRPFQGRHRGPERPALHRYLAWGALAALLFVIGRPLVKLRPARPTVSQPMYVAGQWARANLPPACVDYLVHSDYAAYWLHVAVLGNARASERSRDDDTYQPKKALIRWIEPDGLPFAIVEDYEELPKDLRRDVDVVQRFGPAAIIKRRGKTRCSGP